jgi:hypothetical protein
MSRKAALKAAQSRIPLNTTWTITTSQNWTVPETGYYTVELHGGGGGGSGSYTVYHDGYWHPEGGWIPSPWSELVMGIGGGGSGDIQSDVPLVKGTTYFMTIGAGGVGGVGNQTPGGQGGTTRVGTLLSCDGGYGGFRGEGWDYGPHSGNIASDGVGGAAGSFGGQGNIYNSSQIYGDGGNGGGAPGVLDYSTGYPGQPGAVILTLTSY